MRDKDVLKAKSLIDKPGSTIINARDGDTGETALMIAIRRRDTPWMGFLLQNGADPNLRDRLPRPCTGLRICWPGHRQTGWRVPCATA